MLDRVAVAVMQVRAYRDEHGTWPALPSAFVEALDLTGEDIEVACETGALRVVFPVLGAARLEAPSGGDVRLVA